MLLVNIKIGFYYINVCAAKKAAILIIILKLILDLFIKVCAAKS